MKTILSLCDYSGNWSRPYRRAGYRVLQVDPKLEHDPKNGLLSMTVQELDNSPEWLEWIGPCHGLMIAPPCTDFSVSGVKYWAEKDRDGRTAASLEIVDHCLSIRDKLCPVWWVLEQPVGRLHKLRPEIGKPRYHQPFWYAGFADDPDFERYTKKTALYGNYNDNLPFAQLEGWRRSSPQGSWIQSLGGSSERTKELRSMTPTGFAEAFFRANP